MSCPEIHGLAAVWRSMLKDLRLRDRAGHVRRQGSIFTVNLEAFTRVKERGKRLQTLLRLECPCIHPLEGQKPHEFIFTIDCCNETERGRLVNASESGSM